MNVTTAITETNNTRAVIDTIPAIRPFVLLSSGLPTSPCNASDLCSAKNDRGRLASCVWTPVWVLFVVADELDAFNQLREVGDKGIPWLSANADEIVGNSLDSFFGATQAQLQWSSTQGSSVGQPIAQLHQWAFPPVTST
jgi:hypothetical protein